MAPWTIRWTDQAIRDLSRLDRSVARRVVAKLEQASANPDRAFTRLAGADESKLRIGDHRLLALLSHDARTILVVRVDHRSRIYRKKG